MNFFWLLLLLHQFTFAQKDQSEQTERSNGTYQSKVFRRSDYLTTNIKFYTEDGDTAFNNYALFRWDGDFKINKTGSLLIDGRADFTRDSVRSNHISLGFGAAIVNHENIIVGAIIKIGSDAMSVLDPSSNERESIGGYSYGGKIFIAAFENKFQAALESGRSFDNQENIHRAFVQWNPDQRYTFQGESNIIQGLNQNSVNPNMSVHEIALMRNFYIRDWTEINGAQMGLYAGWQNKLFSTGITLRINHRQ